MLPVSQLDYHLPEDLIATEPADRRDAARLLVTSRSNPALIDDRQVSDLPDILRSGDLLVLNVSKVIAARFLGERADTCGRVEGLYLGPPSDDAFGSSDAPSEAGLWRVMLKGKRLREGVEVAVFDRFGARSGLTLRLIRRVDDSSEAGAWVVESRGGSAFGNSAISVLDRVGLPPLPPYILAARKRLTHAAADADEIDVTARTPVERAADVDRYQTVFARADRAGSVAAPTAGLHFTPELLARLDQRGVGIAHVTLHVGTGTFKPVESEFLQQHPMHSEWCSVPGATAAAIHRTRAAGGRVIAVGTTSVRTLESFTPEQLHAAAANQSDAARWTNILIAPGHNFRHIDGVMTNFHLPRSTLLALVSALYPQGPDRVRAIYAHAVERRYRFYSFGDAMLAL